MQFSGNFEHIWAQVPCLGSKLRWAPLTKILDPPLSCSNHNRCRSKLIGNDKFEGSTKIRTFSSALSCCAFSSVWCEDPDKGSSQDPVHRGFRREDVKLQTGSGTLIRRAGLRRVVLSQKRQSKTSNCNETTALFVLLVFLVRNLPFHN